MRKMEAAMPFIFENYRHRLGRLLRAPVLAVGCRWTRRREETSGRDPPPRPHSPAQTATLLTDDVGEVWVGLTLPGWESGGQELAHTPTGCQEGFAEGTCKNLEVGRGEANIPE